MKAEISKHYSVKRIKFFSMISEHIEIHLYVAYSKLEYLKCKYCSTMTRNYIWDTDMASVARKFKRMWLFPDANKEK